MATQKQKRTRTIAWAIGGVVIIAASLIFAFTAAAGEPDAGPAGAPESGKRETTLGLFRRSFASLFA